MAGLDKRSLDEPDESRRPDKTVLDVVSLPGATVGRIRLEPGWRWSECIKPIVGTTSCQTSHLGYVIAGHLHLRDDSGAELDIGPGDAYQVAPGHDAWVVGEEQFVALEFDSKTAETYATG
jgi:hypothetical protein